MKLSIRITPGIAAAILLGAASLTPSVPGATAGTPPTAEPAEPAGRKPGDGRPADNEMCYVCHLTLKTERLTTVHQKEGHGCTKCHGPSNDHMHDEMLMTTPDLKYGRRQVAPMCRVCHQHPHHHVAEKVKDFRRQWRGKERPNGRAITEESICTDCHGTHNIDKGLKAETGKQPAEWVSLFNGRDLTGWRASGGAQWKVKLGRIAGAPGDESGDLLSREEYEDYLMAVTFRADWSVGAPGMAAGIWLRAADTDPGPRVEICRGNGPAALVGSVGLPGKGLPGKGLVLANSREDLFDAGGWNTLSMEVRGSRIAVWLNGAEVGAVNCRMPPKGRIGLHLEGGPPHEDTAQEDPAHEDSAGENAQLVVREVQIRSLPKAAEKR